MVSHILSFRPDLLSVLAQQLQSADVLASHRVFMVLFRTLKELSTKRLAVDQKNYAEVISFYRSHLSMCVPTQLCLCFVHWYFCFILYCSDTDFIIACCQCPIMHETQHSKLILFLVFLIWSHQGISRGSQVDCHNVSFSLLSSYWIDRETCLPYSIASAIVSPFHEIVNMCWKFFYDNIHCNEVFT